MLSRKEQKENGAVVIEAILSLTLFLFMFMMFYDTVRICLIQAKVHYALCETAKEISEYSYFYYLTGIKDKTDELAKIAEDKKEDFNKNIVQTISGIGDNINSIGNAAGSVTIQGAGLKEILENLKGAYSTVEGDVKDIGTQVSAIKSYLKEQLSNPKEMIKSVLQVFASDGIDTLKNYIGECLAESMCPKYYENSYLYDWDSIDYSGTMLFPAGTSDIILVATYDVEIVPYLPLTFEYTLSQQAVTTGWLGGDGFKTEKTTFSKEEKKQSQLAASLWTESTNPDERASYIRKLVLKDIEAEEHTYPLSGNSQMHAYDPISNTITYIGTSDCLYGAASIDDFDEEQCKEYLLKVANKFENATPHTVKYKQQTERIDGGYDTVTETVLLSEEKFTNINKQFILVIPEDPQLKEKYQAVWNSLVAEGSADSGIDLRIEPAFGQHFVETETTEGSEGNGEE